LDNTKRISFVLSIIVNECSDIFAAASLKSDSIDMEIIERFEEQKRQMGSKGWQTPEQNEVVSGLA
jgi:hypothetical protein